jgi:hypothetical protein
VPPLAPSASRRWRGPIKAEPDGRGVRERSARRVRGSSHRLRPAAVRRAVTGAGADRPAAVAPRSTELAGRPGEIEREAQRVHGGGDDVEIHARQHSGPGVLSRSVACPVVLDLVAVMAEPGGMSTATRSPSLLARAEIETLAGTIASVLERCRSGEMTGTAAMVHRLEGALTALETVLGRRASLLDQLTEPEPEPASAGR